MLDAFRIKHALKEIGLKNKAYGDIFAYYESLERRCDLLERRLQKQTEEMEQQAKSFQKEREEKALQLQMLQDEKDAKVAELAEEKEKHAQCRKDLRSLRQKYDKLRHSSESQGDLAADDDGGDGDDLLVDRLRAQLDSQKRKAYEDRQKLEREYEKQIKELKEELEMYKGKGEGAAETFKGDLASLTPAVLKAAAKKNGWNARALPFLLNEEDQDIDQVCKQLKIYQEKLKKLESDTKRKMDQFDGASMVLVHSADFLLSSSMSSDDLLAAIAGGDDGKPRVHKVATECKSGNLLGAAKELAMLAAKVVEKLKREKDDAARRGTSHAGGEVMTSFGNAGGSRPGNDDSEEIKRLLAENQRLTVALEELRFRLQKLESLANSQGKGGDVRSLLMESGLDLGGSMQDWALRNVWERLYSDAIARHERAATRFLNSQKAFELEMMSKAELYRLVGVSALKSPPSPVREDFRQPIMETERSARLPDATVEMNWNNNISQFGPAFGGYGWDEDASLQKARHRVHELIASQGGRVKESSPRTDAGGKHIKLAPVAKPKTTKSMPPASWRNLGSSAPVPQPKPSSQKSYSKQVVLEQVSGKGMEASMSSPDLGKTDGVAFVRSKPSLVVSGQSRADSRGGIHKGEDMGTRPGTESTRAGTRPGTTGLSTRPGTHDGFHTRPTTEEHQRGVPDSEAQPTWMPAPLGRR